MKRVKQTIKRKQYTTAFTQYVNGLNDRLDKQWLKESLNACLCCNPDRPFILYLGQPKVEVL